MEVENGKSESLNGAIKTLPPPKMKQLPTFKNATYDETTSDQTSEAPTSPTLFILSFINYPWLDSLQKALSETVRRRGRPFESIYEPTKTSVLASSPHMQARDLNSRYNIRTTKFTFGAHDDLLFATENVVDQFYYSPEIVVVKPENNCNYNHDCIMSVMKNAARLLDEYEDNSLKSRSQSHSLPESTPIYDPIVLLLSPHISLESFMKSRENFHPINEAYFQNKLQRDFFVPLQVLRHS